MFMLEGNVFRSNLTGVVLMGGQSSRMGFDKSSISINNRLLYQRAAGLRNPFCHQIILSVNANQANGLNDEYPVVIDIYKAQGPMGGILSCYEAGYDMLLVLAVDLVNIGTKEINKILELYQLNQGRCTMYYNVNNSRYEPMLSIWPSKVLKKLKICFDKGERSLHRFLKNESVNLCSVDDEMPFVNINTKGELSSWLSND